MESSSSPVLFCECPTDYHSEEAINKVIDKAAELKNDINEMNAKVQEVSEKSRSDAEEQKHIESFLQMMGVNLEFEHIKGKSC